MFKHVWTVVCENAIIDSETSLASIVNVIEKIDIYSDPTAGGFLHTKYNVITLWIRSDDEVTTTGKFRLVFESPSGNELGSFDGTVDLTEDRITARTVFRFESIPLPESGRYHFCVEQYDEEQEAFLRVFACPIIVNFWGAREMEVKPDESEETQEAVSPENATLEL